MLLKVFPEIKAVSNHELNLLPEYTVEISNVERMIACSMSKLSKTYAENMPDWVVAKNFDLGAERHRLLIHDYQQTELQQIRCIGCKNTKLVDSVELPLKSLDNVLTAVNKVLSSGQDIYLNQFVAPFIGDWRMQFLSGSWFILIFLQYLQH